MLYLCNDVEFLSRNTILNKVCILRSTVHLNYCQFFIRCFQMTLHYFPCLALEGINSLRIVVLYDAAVQITSEKYYFVRKIKTALLFRYQEKADDDFFCHINFVSQHGTWASLNPHIESGNSSVNLFFHACPAGYCGCSFDGSLGGNVSATKICVYQYRNSNPSFQCSCDREGESMKLVNQFFLALFSFIGKTFIFVMYDLVQQCKFF